MFVKVGLNIASRDTLIGVSEARTAVGTQFRRGVSLARTRSSTMVLVFWHWHVQLDFNFTLFTPDGKCLRVCEITITADPDLAG